MKGVVYQLLFPSGKSYVGQTTQLLRKRLAHHRCASTSNHCRLVWKAINKYGWNKVQVKTLATVDETELDALEIHHIAELDTMAPNGYNLEPGGTAHNDPAYREQKRVESVANWKDPEVRKRRTEGLTRAFANPATVKRRKDDQEMKAFQATMKAVHKRPGMKAKHSKACADAKKRLTPEQRRQAVLKSWEVRRAKKAAAHQHGGVVGQE